jgi:hypothetical protein
MVDGLPEWRAAGALRGGKGDDGRGPVIVHPARPVAPLPGLGLRATAKQFSLLVLVNVFVGATIGLERILPAIAEPDFHLVAHTAMLSFIVVFGVST